MEAINLTEEQILYLQHILYYWRKTNDWPTHRYLNRRFYQLYPGLNIEKIRESLPPDLVCQLDLYQPDSKAMLTVPAIYFIEKDAPEIEVFIRVLQECIGEYDPFEDNWINSEMIISARIQWRATLLLAIEPHVWQSFIGPDDSGSWRGKQDKLMRRFRGVTTIEQYLQKRDPYASISSTSETTSADISITAECILHPDIHEKCLGLYTQGDYDNAILNATKAIEIAVRKKSSLPDHLTGTAIMGQAFESDNPKLLYSAIKSEQEGMRSLLCGVIGVYKNPQSHRFVGIEDKSECLGIMLICSSLLYTIDNTSVARSESA